VVQADRVHAEFLATSTIWSSASSVSCATVVLMLTRSGAPFLRPRPADYAARPRAFERAFHAARAVVHLARAVNRHTDVFARTLAGEVASASARSGLMMVPFVVR
jgi:hypothetical protein